MFSTDFKKCEWCVAFLESCAKDKRNNQIQNKFYVGGKFLKIRSSINLSHGVSQGPIGSAILTFIGNKQTNKQVNK